MALFMKVMELRESVSRTYSSAICPDALYLNLFKSAEQSCNGCLGYSDGSEFSNNLLE